MMVVCVISKIKHYGLGPVNRSLLIDLQGLTPQPLHGFSQEAGSGENRSHFELAAPKGKQWEAAKPNTRFSAC